MTNHKPRYENWASRTVTAIFLLFVGGLINQFLNIPAQQARTDAKLAIVEKQVVTNTPLLHDLQDRMDALEQQHVLIMEEQARQAKMLKDISDRLDTHDRRSRGRK